MERITGTVAVLDTDPTVRSDDASRLPAWARRRRTAARPASMETMATTVSRQPSRRARWLALAAGLATSAIWGSSFVLIDLALVGAGPLTLAGLRYSLAALPLVPLLARGGARVGGARTWLLLAAAGLLAYPVANGLLFTALTHVHPTTVSLIFNQQPLLVLVVGMAVLREWPRPLQVVGIGVAALSLLLYFGVPEDTGPIWLLAALAAAVAFAGYSVLARALARDGRIGVVPLTAWPLVIGGGVLLGLGLLTQGGPRPSLWFAGLVAWLALANTTLAYLLWNQALRHLRAFEVNVLLGLGPIETALIAWPWLHQAPSPQQWAGMLGALAGIVLVQLGARGRTTAAEGALPAGSGAEPPIPQGPS